MSFLKDHISAEVWRLSLRRLGRWTGVPLSERLTDFLETADRMILGDMALEEAASVLAAFHDLSRFEEGGAAEEFWNEIFSTSRKLTRRRNQLGMLRSLWGVTPIASISYGARADRQLGIASDSLVFNTYYITSNFDVNLSKLETFIIKDHYGLSYTFRRYVLAWSLLNYDIFHLYNDRGLMEPAGGYGSDRFGINLTEIKAYAKAGKFLFAYAYGADYRMRNRTLASAPLNFCMECPDPGKFCLCDDVGGMKMLETIRDNATCMIGFGLSLELLPGARFMNYLVADMDELVPALNHAPPQNLPEAAPLPHPEVLRREAAEPRRMTGQSEATLRGSQALAPQGEGGVSGQGGGGGVGSGSKPDAPLRVGHFPNHGFFKGSRFLLKAIEELQGEGKAIELVQFSGLPRTEILEAMQTVDVVVDQLISGSFGLTAIEAMALGQPVIGHLRKNVPISARADCPIIEATPDSIKTVLNDLINDRSRLCGLGAKGQKFTYQNHSIEALSGELAQLYRERISPSFVAKFKIWRGDGKARKAIAARCAQAEAELAS